MQLLTKVLPDNHNLFHFGDLHDGSVLSSRKGWNKLLDMMNSEYDGCSSNYGVDGGDMMEAILVDDVRFSPEKLTESLPLEQRKEAIKLREPIRDKLLAILLGNHEYRLWKYGNMTKDICEALGVDYGTYSAKITIEHKGGWLHKGNNLMYKIYETHGYKNISSIADDPIRRQSNMQLILKRHLKRKAGDCAVMIKHHCHKLLLCKPEEELYLVDDGEKVKQAYTHWGQAEPYIHPDARWYGSAGSFLKLYGKGISGYAEIMEYDPVELGFLITKVRDRKIVDVVPIYLDL
jgi:hypothetical protein